MTDLKDLLPSIAVIPFPKIVYSEVIDRYAELECPKCLGIGNFYNVQEFPPYLSAYCPGNQPPEVEHQDFLGGKHKHPVNCAGIKVEHFHVKCRACDYFFYVGLPERKEKNG